MSDEINAYTGPTLGDWAPSSTEGVSKMLELADTNLLPTLPATMLDDHDQDMKSTAKKTLSSLRIKADGIKSKIGKMTSDIDSQVNDQTVYPEGRKAMAEATYETQSKEIDDDLDHFEVLTDIAVKMTEELSMPPVPKKDAGQLARLDAQTFVTSGDAFMEAAARGDDLAGLLLSDWGLRFMTARGIKNAESVHNLAHIRQIETEAKNNNPYAKARLSLTGKPIAQVRSSLAGARNYATPKIRRSGR